MRNRMCFAFAMALSLVMVVSPVLAATGTTSGVDHSRKIKTYAGPATCLACHSASKMGSNLAEDVFNSAHFQLRTTTSFIDMPGSGSHGMLDRACGLPGTTLMANNYAHSLTALDGVTKLDEGCGKCHVAYRPPYAYPTAASAVNDIDCLICHADYYGAEWNQPGGPTNSEPHARVVIALADGSASWSQDRSTTAAKTVGNLPKAKYCLRCHAHNMNVGYKRATPFDAAHDVHAAKGVDCRSCHIMQQHRIARGDYVTDGVANDLPNVEVSCSTATCHGAQPHLSTNSTALNKHTTNVSCEVCHIPDMNIPDNISKRAWAPSTLNPLTGAWDSTPARTAGELYPGFFDAFTAFHELTATPAIRWFNGGASMLAQPYGGFADRASVGGKSKLFALKPFTNGMLFDAGWLPGPPSTYDHVNNTWPYSMKWFYEQNWSKFSQFGFASAGYPTAGSFWAARPDMAAMLNNFPMMLQFDRGIYLTEAGLAGTATPTGSVENGTTYPGIVHAVNVGMWTMGKTMGYPMPPDPAQIIGSMWSGTFFGMWVPVNMDPSSPFQYEIGSFITMSHAVKPAAQMGQPCFTCHMTPDEYKGNVAVGAKRLDFAKLGYQDLDANGKIDPACEAASIPKVSSIVMTIAKGKTSETLTIKLTVVNCKDNLPMAGQVVNGTLSVVPAASGLPKTFTGTSAADGTVTFSYAKKTLTTGTYTFTTKDPSVATQTLIK